MLTTIVMNGPPSSGKDTIGRLLADELNARVFQFKSELWAQLAKHYHVDIDTLWEWNETAESKSQPRPELGDQSMREAAIHMSEVLTKPVYGDTYYGQCLATQLFYYTKGGETAGEKGGETDAMAVVTDSGFLPELLPVYQISDRLIVVKLYRPGCDFTGDSRGYLLQEELPEDVQTIAIDNTETPKLAVLFILAQLK